MCWREILYRGALNLVGFEGNMDSRYYFNIVQDCLIDENSSLVGEDWILQKDNAAVHTFNYTKEWLKDSDVNIVDCPFKIPDLNIIENIWRILARKVYQDRRKSDDV